jgi:hypothetical protein
LEKDGMMRVERKEPLPAVKGEVGEAREAVQSAGNAGYILSGIVGLVEKRQGLRCPTAGTNVQLVIIFPMGRIKITMQKRIKGNT